MVDSASHDLQALQKDHEESQTLDIISSKNYPEVETDVVQKSIVLIAFHRSGSSFTGELLNQHPDVFYSYEPLTYINGGGSNFQRERLEAVKNISKCVLPNFSVDKSIVTNQDENIDYYIKGNFVFRTKSRRLCSGQFCNFENHDKSDQCEFKCPDVDTKKAKEVCQKLIPAAKVIRLPEIELIKACLDTCMQGCYLTIF